MIEILKQSENKLKKIKEEILENLQNFKYLKVFSNKIMKMPVIDQKNKCFLESGLILSVLSDPCPKENRYEKFFKKLKNKKIKNQESFNKKIKGDLFNDHLIAEGVYAISLSDNPENVNICFLPDNNNPDIEYFYRGSKRYVEIKSLDDISPEHLFFNKKMHIMRFLDDKFRYSYNLGSIYCRDIDNNKLVKPLNKHNSTIKRFVNEAIKNIHSNPLKKDYSIEYIDKKQNLFISGNILRFNVDLGYAASGSHNAKWDGQEIPKDVFDSLINRSRDRVLDANGQIARKTKNPKKGSIIVYISAWPYPFLWENLKNEIYNKLKKETKYSLKII